MANPAAQAREKAQAQWPGATVHARGRNWIRHQHPTEPNRFALDVSIGPMHYGPSENQEIDTAWQPTSGAWQYEMTANDFQTYARDTFNVGGLFQFEKSGQSLMFDPQSINWIDENLSRQQIAIKQPVAATVNDDTLHFPGAYGAGIDFSYQNQTARLQKLITIDQFSRLPAPTVQGQQVWFEAEFAMSISAELEFWIDGQLWNKRDRTATANNIEVRDTSGQTLWHLPAPKAYDSADEFLHGQLEVRRQGGPSSLFVTVRIPYAFFQAATYPIFIDPTVDVIVAAGADDAYEQKNDTQFLSTGRVFVNANTTDANGYIGGFRFTATGPASGNTVNNAYLYNIYWQNSSYDSVDVDIFCEDVDNAANFTTTADVVNRAKTTASTAWAQVDAGDNATTSSFTSSVQEVFDRAGWSSGNAIMVLLQGTTNATYSSRINSYETSTTNCPKLYIDYTASGGSGGMRSIFGDRGGIFSSVVR